MNFYLITCDKTNWILKTFAHMAKKMWDREYIVLGFNKPPMPDRFRFISMGKKQESIQSWTRDIYNIIKYDTSEYVIFGLDDFIMIDKFNEKIFNEVVEYMKENDVSRYELGYGSSAKKKYKIVKENPTYKIFEFEQDTNYRVSCQVSVWKKSYLLKMLDHNWTPWEFEIKGSKLANHDGAKIIGTLDNFAIRCIEESMLSGRHPDNVNVLGLRSGYIEELIGLGYIDQNKIQYGMARGDNPKTLDIEKIGSKYKKYYL